ncbi:MAG: quinohemoprotein amine dehydrogenase subunit beta [Lautropia sp.]|nr:quinohemoprotein amine dehydrogenase subunit beta [Lautropia sp.]
MHSPLLRHDALEHGPFVKAHGPSSTTARSAAAAWRHLSTKHLGCVLSVLAGLALIPQGAAVAADQNTAGKKLVPGHEYLAVTNYPNNLHLIDAQTDTLYKSCRLPDAFGPGTVQISPDRTRAYVLNNRYGALYGIELDSCRLVFKAELSQKPDERAVGFFSIAVSPDGKSIYSIANRSRRKIDHYVVLEPQLLVFNTGDGVGAKPVKTFPAPRQTTLMQVAKDGSLFVVGPDIYRFDPKTGKHEVAVPLRNWKREGYGTPDVLYVWPQQRPQGTFNILYTAPRFKPGSEDPETADVMYGFVDIDLQTGKHEVTDFAEFSEVFFTGGRSPKDPNQMFGVLNHLGKYDVKQQKQIGLADLDHTYYCIAFNQNGSKIYLAGALKDVAVYDPDSLKKLKTITLPGGDMAISTAQMFTR